MIDGLIRRLCLSLGCLERVKARWGPFIREDIGRCNHHKMRQRN